MSTLDRINVVNIGLMLVAAAVAYVRPFETFLTAYAVLGPLHYLTEISWLHDRGYYTTGRYDVLPLLALAGLDFAAFSGGWVAWNGVVFTAFGLATVAAVARDGRVKLAAGGLVLAASFIVPRWTPAAVFFAVLLATVVHVYVFTACFILQGALRSRSRSGMASLAVLLACGVALLFHRPPAGDYAVSVATRAQLEPFLPMLSATGRLVGADEQWAHLVAVGRFVAFAYTYHYLNWFSKTEVIRWHLIGRGRLAAIGVLWVLSLALYGYRYDVGLTALYVLSLAHVFLEFPLDVRTIAAIGRDVRGLTPGAG